MSIKTKTLVGLIFLGLVDMLIPVPILGMTLIYIVFQRPPWFADLVDKIYKSG